jgi:hypothetical protein
MTVPSLLPSNRTPWELALSNTSGARRLLPTSLVASLWNVDTCPARLLGWMAQQFSLDVWDEAWPETEKRETIRKALLLHRLKTTAAGIKQHVALTGATVKRIIRPPGGGFLYAAMTADQRKAWLDSLPQVRIYPFATRTEIRAKCMFLSGPGGKRFHTREAITLDGVGSYSPVGFPVQTTINVQRTVVGFMSASRGRALSGRRATLYDLGVETDIQYEALDGIAAERVLISGARKRTWHGHGFEGSGHLQSTDAATKIVTVSLSDDNEMFAVGRGVDVVDVRPQRISQPRVAPAARAFCGRFRAGTFLRTSYAPLMIYDRISLLTPDRMGVQRKTRSYHGHGRFGIAPYTAELRIRVPMKRGVRRAGRWHGAGYRQAADMGPLTRAIEAVRVSKAFRDTVLIDTATYGQVHFSSGLRFGDFTFGEIKEVA